MPARPPIPAWTTPGTQGPKGEPVAWQPNRYKVADALDALAAATHLDDAIQPPTWTGGAGGFPTAAPCRARTACCMLTRACFTAYTGVLRPAQRTVRVRSGAHRSPRRGCGSWASCGRYAPDSTESLRQRFGYVLFSRTGLQKILLMIRPRRSGKGTVARVLSAMIGKANVAGPTPASLGTNFGLSPLLGKPLAVISDATLAGADVHQVVERLLSVFGEDLLTVDRKYRDPWTGYLPERFVVLFNELPRFGDAWGWRTCSHCEYPPLL